MLAQYIMEFDKKKKLFGKKEKDINLTFFDTAGENLDSKTMMEEHNRYLSYSSAIMLLLDPLQIMAVREKLNGKIKLPDIRTDVEDIVERVIHIVEKERKKNKKEKFDVNVAIVFTKIDAVDILLEPSSCLKNDSSHISKGYFDKNDFDDESAEMKSLVSSWLGDSLCNNLERNFENVGYFGVSALGSVPEEGSNKIAKFRPFRVADPFLWLLALDGRINSQ